MDAYQNKLASEDPSDLERENILEAILKGVEENRAQLLKVYSKKLSSLVALYSTHETFWYHALPINCDHLGEGFIGSN